MRLGWELARSPGECVSQTSPAKELFVSPRALQRTLLYGADFDQPRFEEEK